MLCRTNSYVHTTLYYKENHISNSSHNCVWTYGENSHESPSTAEQCWIITKNDTFGLNLFLELYEQLNSKQQQHWIDTILKFIFNFKEWVLILNIMIIATETIGNIMFIVTVTREKESCLSPAKFGSLRNCSNWFRNTPLL